MILYYREHCHFCTRVRMIAGCKNIPLNMIVAMEGDDNCLPRNQIHTSVPVLEVEKNNTISDSSCIIDYLDKLTPPLIYNEIQHDIYLWCLRNFNYVNRLTLPRFAQANIAELSTRESRQSFIYRKTRVFGDFQFMLKDTQKLSMIMISALAGVNDYVKSNKPLSASDIHLFPILNLLTIIKGFPMPDNISDYLLRISSQCKIDTFSCYSS